MEFKFKATPMPRRSLTTGKIMQDLLAGLLVVYAFGLFNAYRIGGIDYLINTILLLVVSVACSIVCEAVYALLIKQPIKKQFKTSFPAITPLILVLTVTPNTSLYAIAVSTIIAVVFGKLVFGGFGQNIFNPAAVGRVVVLQSFAGRVALDAVASATITSQIAGLNWILEPNSLIRFIDANGGLLNITLGLYEGAIGETCTLLIILVGIVLAIRDVIDWRIPAVYLGLLFGAATIAGAINGLGIDYGITFISTGGAAFAGVFMLTDPVTNPQTRPGKIVFAALAALFTITIRLLANLPEGVVYSILLVNILSPAIDKLFSTKQIDSIKRNSIITFGVIGAVLLFGSLMINSVTPGKYKVETSANSGTSTTEKELLIDADYSEYEAIVTSVDGNIYHVTVHGFHALNNGPDNEFDIEIEDGTVKSVVCSVFSDTEGIGSLATETDELAKYAGVRVNDQVDVLTGSTFTSNSINAAIQAALKEASE